MKITHGLLAVLLVCCIAPPVPGQTEKITLYADAAGTDCSVTETVPGIVSMYMFHVGSGVRRASKFTAPKPACWTGAVWAGDVISPGLGVAIGNTQSDFTLYYNYAGVSCFQEPNPLPLYIGTINYFVVSPGPSCCEYPVLPASDSEVPGSVITVLCVEPPSLIAIGAGKVTINETEDCPCDPPVAVEETTWGRVKAFYR